MSTQAKRENEIMEKNADMLYERRNMLNSARMKHSDSLDKYLLTFATGSLYLSISFTSSIDKGLQSIRLLSVGWILLLTSIITILFSFYCGEKSHNRQIEITDERIKNLYKTKKKNVGRNNWNVVIEVLKILSISSFTVGISFLTYFYFINL